MSPLLRASLVVVRQPTLAAPAFAALLLPVVMIGVLDSGDLLTVLRWEGVLAACVLIAAVDDPSGEVLAAAPYSRAARVGARLAVALGIGVPLWALAGVLAHLREPSLPVLALAVEALALSAVGIAVAIGLRCWRDLHRPSQLAAIVLLATYAALGAAPRWYALEVAQTWGPPWVAAHLRWSALAVLGGAVVVAALRDPLDRRR